MKLATFSRKGESSRPGLVSKNRITDIRKHLPFMPPAVLEIIERWPELRPQLESLPTAGDYDLSEVVLEAPIARPSKILCMGLNYRDHAAEAGVPLPEAQMWFLKGATTVNAPYGDILLPRSSDHLDYEAELCVVIGKRLKYASSEQVRAAIFGYCVANDGSLRDWQLRTSQVTLGKSFDTQCPYGPWIVTADEIPDPHALGIRTFVNGEVRQNSNTREMIFNVYAMVEYLSQAMTLEPGDLILTGTPAGVGFAYKPPRYLKAGDVLRIEIDGVGSIENRIVAET